MVATEVFEELQVTEVVITWVLPSEYVPVAVNCWVSPAGNVGVGVTAIETRVAGFTVSTAVLLVMPPEVAVIFELPTLRLVASPEALMEATAPLLEFQVAELVRSAVLPSV